MRVQSFLTFLKKSFFVRIIALMCLVSSIPLLVTAYLALSISNQTTIEEVSKLNLQIVARVVERVETTLLRAHQVSNTYSMLPNITRLIELEGSEYDKVMLKKEVLSILDMEKVTADSIYDVAIYIPSTDYVYSTLKSELILEQSNYRELIQYFLNQEVPFMFYGDQPQDSDLQILRDNMVYIRKLPFSATSNYTALLMVSLSHDSFKEAIKNVDLGSNGAIYITTSSGKIIATTNNEDIEQVQLHTNNLLSQWNENNQSDQFNYDESVVTVQKSSELYDFHVISEMPTADLLQNNNELKRTIFISSTILIVIALMGTVGLAFYLFRPLQLLRTHMGFIQRGQFDTMTRPYPHHEVGDLGRALTTMSSQLKQLIQDVKTNQELKRHHEIRALQSQINPHFLYNTLNTISMYATLKDYQKIKQMMHSLLPILRYTMKNHDQFEPLINEISYTVDYINLLQLRYDKPFELVVEMDEDCHSIPFPKLLIQPLIENAIFHGILAKDSSKGTIVLKVSKSDEDLCLQVIDDGQGIPLDRLQEIREYLDQDQNERGIGVKNVNDRIKLIYGEQSRLEIDSLWGAGTIISIRIPIDFMNRNKE
jgi:two-component system, sensor histidine kinase YesM